MAFIPEQRAPLYLGIISLGLFFLAFLARCKWGREQIRVTHDQMDRVEASLNKAH